MGKLFDIVKNNPVVSGLGFLVLAGVGAFLAFGVFGIQAAFIDDVASEEEVAENQDLLDSFRSEGGISEDDSAEVDDEEFDETDSTITDGEEPDETDSTITDDEAPETTVVEDENSETTVQEPTSTQAPTTAAVSNVNLTGTFVNAPSYDSEGSVEVLGNGSETRVFLLNDFVTDNGPDLKVYLRAANGDFISLGDLQNNIGASNYLVPPETDLSVYNTVQIWCERFGGEFGSAPIA